MWLFLSVICIIALLIGCLNRVKNLQNDMLDIRRDVDYLRRRINGEDTSIGDETLDRKRLQKYTERIEDDEFPETPEISEDEEPVSPYDVPVEQAPRNERRPRKVKEDRGVEFNLGAKLPVWIGAIALIFAGFYLVKYSIESGWLQPSVRLSLGALFGCGLLCAGHWLVRHPQIANALRMAQGLVGAGLVTLYVCLYAAVNLYHLLGAVPGFVGMAAVTVIAVIMSLRYGQPIAVFGLIGGLVTPGLISSDDPNALVLFSYLFLLSAGLIFLFTRKGWWALAMLAVMGMLAWVGLWFATAFSSGDNFILILFSMGLCFMVLLSTGHVIRSGLNALSENDRKVVHGLNMLAMAGGVATIIWLSMKVDLTVFDWGMMGLLTLAGYALAFFVPRSYRNFVFIKMAVDLVLFAFWQAMDSSSLYMLLAAGLFVIYTIIPMLLMRRSQDPRLWAALQLVSAVAIYLIAYFRLPMFRDYQIPFEQFWGMLALIVASYSVYLAQYARNRYRADEGIRNTLVAIYALAATAFLSMGIVIEVPWAYVPIAIALQGMATVWIYNSTRIDFLERIVVGLAIIFLCLNWEQISLFWSLIGSSIVGDMPRYRNIDHMMLVDPLIKLGLPALLWAIALSLYVRVGNQAKFLTGLMFSVVLFMTTFLTYYLLKGVFHPGHDYFSQVSTFCQRGVITLLIAGAGMAMFYAAKGYAVCGFMHKWGVLFFKLAMIRLAYFDLLIMNPYFNGSQNVGDAPLLNGVTMVYGAGFLLSLWAIYTTDRRVEKVAGQKFYGCLALVFLFFVTSLNVRQFFHGGNLVEGHMDSTEFYTYSILWLFTGLALLAYGIIRQNRTARMASLAFMLLTIGKVFFFDASELEGLYRVFSFFGLGVSLIGLSYFYSRYVFRAQDEKV